ncbi:ABC transporter permease [Plantactinospora endophytica]|uniref:ABC-2 type transporter transmembrane domain-containing protein n=1 Tax=Plantactinospora endophytica TaxID=673535 RepID=A0ABQ4EEI4_9ACTN|nr:ABC transporter permease [Plantactinospora endophytica]GIG93133.1 hypothetical protein Pen02_80690 [Plantactinospora endophytica]
MTATLAAVRLQWWLMRGSLDDRQSFILAPLFVLLLVGAAYARGRQDLIPQAALGAVLISLWNICVQVGGGIVSNERRFATFELAAASPAAFPLLVLGRVSTVVGVALLVIPEVWLATLLFFGTAVTVAHPGLFAIALLLTTFGMIAVAGFVAALFVLARNALYLQIAFTYPFFILGGLVVPVSMLPEWLGPVSRLVFLSWGGDLLRASLDPQPPAGVGKQVTGLLVASIVTFALGQVLLGRLVDRARRHGSLGLA